MDGIGAIEIIIKTLIIYDHYLSLHIWIVYTRKEVSISMFKSCDHSINLPLKYAIQMHFYVGSE